MRFPVQYVNRPNLDFRGFCGTLASGVVHKGDELMALPSRKTSKVKTITTYDGELDEAFAPMSVTLTLEDEIDVSRGDMLVPPGNVPRVDQRFDAMIVWMDDQPLLPGKDYLFKQATKTTGGVISTLRYRVDVNTLHRIDTPSLGLNEIGRTQVTLNQPIAFDSYRRNQGTGSFVVIDRLTNVTVGAGMILEQSADGSKDLWAAEPRSGDLHQQHSNVSDQQRQARFGQTPVTILLTGLTGAGKTTIAYALERRLFDEGRAVCVLDGQNMRRGISRDLGFSVDDRSENLRRVAEIAKLINASGMIAICAMVAPNAEVREKARQTIGEDQFLEVYLSAPVEVCRQRDTDGMYPKADDGTIERFPGVSAPYDEPAAADLTLPTDSISVADCVTKIVDLLKERKIIA